MATDSTTERPKVFTTPIGRLSYPQLFKKKGFANQDPCYSATLIMAPDEDLTPLKRYLASVAIEKWQKVPPGIKSPIRANSEKEGKAGYKDAIGGFFLSAKNDRTPPKIVGRDGRTPITEESNLIYPGCYVRLQVTAWAWHYPETKANGVSLTLWAVQKVSDGEPLTADVEFEGFEPVDPAAFGLPGDTVAEIDPIF